MVLVLLGLVSGVLAVIEGCQAIRFVPKEIRRYDLVIGIAMLGLVLGLDAIVLAVNHYLFY